MEERQIRQETALLLLLLLLLQGHLPAAAAVAPKYDGGRLCDVYGGPLGPPRGRDCVPLCLLVADVAGD